MATFDLEGLREQIDDIDRQLIELLDERARRVSQVASAKGRGTAPVSDPTREARIVARALEWLEQHPHATIPAASVRRIFNVVMQESRAWQAGRSVAFLGPQGTYCHLAAMEALGAAGSLRPEKAIEGVFASVGSGKTTYGVVPIENSIEGPVGQTLDLLGSTDVVIVAQVRLSIHHAALSSSQDLSLDDVKTVYSHPQALAQCRKWLSTRLPGARLVPTSSTASEIESLILDVGSPPDWIVLAGRHVAELYGLHILEEGIADNPSNATLFATIRMREAHRPRSADDEFFPTGEVAQWKTSVLLTLPHAAGALYKALQPIGEEGVNMLRIQSRPVPEHPWEYKFFVDLEGRSTDPAIERALEGLRGATGTLQHLGSYPLLDLSPRRG